MPSRRYTRIDIPVAIRKVGDRLVVSSGPDELTLDPGLPEATLLATIADWLSPRLNPPVGAESDFTLERVVLRIEAPAWAAINWERLVSDRMPWLRPAVVRASRVQPRVRQPFIFPARVLELGADRNVAAAIERVVSGSHDRSAVVVESSALESAQQTVAALKWPTVDVVHLHDLGPDPDLLRTSAGDEPGTLGWMLRMSAMWQSRLIVVDAAETSLPLLRRLGQAVVDRAGPAVILASRGTFDQIGLYASLFHDRPFDWAQKHVTGVALFAGAGREEALRFSIVAERVTQPQSAAAILTTVRRVRLTPIGAKHLQPSAEDIAESIDQAARQLRIDVGSNGVRIGWEHPPKRIRFGDAIAARMLDKGYVVRPLDRDMKALDWSTEYVAIQTIAGHVAARSLSLNDVLDATTVPRIDEIVQERLDNLAESVQELEFEDHEGDGTLPVALKTLHLRNLVRAARGPRRRRTRGSVPRQEARQVNARFHEPSDEGPARPIPQAGARFTPGREIHLAISVGENDPTLVTIGSMALDEQSFQWGDGQNGCWIEIGVTSLDFELLGAPLQEVWLPREGEMQLVTFPLAPKRATAVPGVARARFTLYYRDNVVQSFRIAARLDSAGADAVPRMAEALGVDVDKIVDANAGYLTRLEYSAADPAQADTLPRRSLSFVANDSVGQKVFTVKGKEVFSSTVNSEMGPLVDDARAALRRASYNDKLDEYRFGPDNSAKSEDVLDRLWAVASAGWKLYQQIVPDPEVRASIADVLGGEGVIHAAHIDLRQVIPWSLLYDLPIDEGRDRVTVQENGVSRTYPVRRDVCPAGFPSADGSLAADGCGVSARCLLHGATPQGQKRVNGEFYYRETVVCPRHFWGFAHQIEVPAQQTQDGVTPARAPTVIAATRPAAVVVGYNPNVQLASTHLDALKLLVNARIQEPNPVERNEILDLLNRVQPDVVYLYCHAYIDKKDSPGRYAPNLDFGKRSASDIVSSADLNGQAWEQHPLVFINGCGSVGFNPAAPSGFITSFIQGRKASVVIGTEVTVWERLATEMGVTFLEEFLGDTPKSAGAALTRARRRLLLKNNPLGLVYTLYGWADLRVEFR